MAGVANPPITQRLVRDNRTGEELLVNGWTSEYNGRTLCAATIEEAVEVLGCDDGFTGYTVLGRRRMNDYVGPPLWSPWEILNQDGTERS